MFEYDGFIRWLGSIDGTLLFILVLVFILLMVPLWSKHLRAKNVVAKRFTAPRGGTVCP